MSSISHSQNKILREDRLGFFIIQLVAKNQTNQKGPFGDIKYFGKRFRNAKTSVTSKLQSCIVTKKAAKTMVANGTLWKHSRKAPT